VRPASLSDPSRSRELSAGDVPDPNCAIGNDDPLVRTGPASPPGFAGDAASEFRGACNGSGAGVELSSRTGRPLYRVMVCVNTQPSFTSSLCACCRARGCRFQRVGRRVECGLIAALDITPDGFGVARRLLCAPSRCWPATACVSSRPRSNDATLPPPPSCASPRANLALRLANRAGAGWASLTVLPCAL
jgi:hypothetical protein